MVQVSNEICMYIPHITDEVCFVQYVTVLNLLCKQG